MDEATSIDAAFKTLGKVRRDDTVFSLVYNIDLMEIHAITALNEECVTIHIADFDFDKGTPAQVANLQRLHTNNVRAQFKNYSTEFNKIAVTSFFRDPVLTSIFKWEVSDEMIHFLAHYPDSFE